MEKAPLFHDLAEGPTKGDAWWVKTADGVRIRLAHWTCGKQSKGTVLMFPGRTEYIEKYGRVAGELAARAYDTLVIDWRGQGLADRVGKHSQQGHVGAFSDYQLDVAAMVEAATELNLPKPWFLIAHSMGGCIGLRALHQGLPVNAAAFSAPMWGIGMKAHERPFAWFASFSARFVGAGETYVPGTGPNTYTLASPYDDNILTTDADMFAYMKRQVTEKPELAIGGPSLHWLYEALSECRTLCSMPTPDMPTITFLGSNERVVDPRPVQDVMQGWSQGELRNVTGAEHEVLMEIPTTRNLFFDEADALFAKRTPVKDSQDRLANG